MSKVSELLVEVTILFVYCFAAILFVPILKTCYVWIYEYLGGPTFKAEKEFMKYYWHLVLKYQ